MSKKNRFVLSLIVNGFTVLSILFFAPLDIYLGNIVNFNFSFNSFWWILLLFSLIVVVLISSVEMFLPELFCQISNAIVFALGICCYVQSMFLNGAMSSLTGETPIYSNSIQITNIFIWLIIFAIVIVLLGVLRKMNRGGVYNKGISFISAALVVMQTVALMTTLLTTDITSYQRYQYLTNEGEFDLSSKNNVIVFILDTCDDKLYVDPLLEKSPEVFEDLKGFTYYPNATSTYSRTYPSVPYLLTKEMCYFNKPYYQFIDQIYEDSDYLTDLKATKADIRIFTDNQYIGKEGSKFIENLAINHEKYPNDIFKMLKKMTKISLYRSSPYAAKSRFFYTNYEINNVFFPVDSAIKEDEIEFYDYLSTTGLTENEDYSSAYRFYHLFGTHSGAFWDENLDYKKEPTMEEALIGDIKLIAEYINQMQKLGIYEDSTIIITADHGNSGAGDPMLYTDTRPIMMIKPAGKGMEDSFEVSNKQISHENLFPTILDALGGDGTKYGTNVSEIEENSNKDRYFYYSGLLTDKDGEIALIKYAINGDASDINNWRYTGEYWNIDYSERPVSKHRMSEYTTDKPQDVPE